MSEETKARFTSTEKKLSTSHSIWCCSTARAFKDEELVDGVVSPSA
jgi:hypothetical protein